MRFFVPGMRNDREMSEHAWLTFRWGLSEMGLPTTRRRIQALVAEIDGADYYIAVGHETPFDDALAILILESLDREHWHICTLEQGLNDTKPWTLAADERWRVVDFE